MSLNTSKCRALPVQFTKGHVECLTNIRRCDSLKLLGVHIDKNFGFKTRIEKLSLKCRQLAFQINRLLKQAYSIREMRHVFEAIVLPRITFCVSIYGGVPKNTPRSFPQPLFLQKVTTYHRRYWFLQNFTTIWFQNVEKNFGNGETFSCRINSASTALCNRESERTTPTNKSCWFPEIQLITRSLPEKRRAALKHEFLLYICNLRY